MIKRISNFIIFSLLIKNNLLAQTYFKIQGANKIFTLYAKNNITQINDSTSIFYYTKNNRIYIRLQISGKSAKPYISYEVLDRKDTVKISSLGRGSNKIRDTRLIEVNIIQPEKATIESLTFLELLNKTEPH